MGVVFAAGVHSRTGTNRRSAVFTGKLVIKADHVGTTMAVVVTVMDAVSTVLSLVSTMAAVFITMVSVPTRDGISNFCT